MALTKTNIIERISKTNNLTRSQSTETVETLLDIMKHALESGEDILISGFGKFSIKG